MDAGDADVVFTSSGTHAHTGHRMNPVQAATIPHLDVSGFRSRRLKPEMLLGADLVLTAESIHRQHVLDDYAQLHRTLFTLGQFEAAIAEIGKPEAMPLAVMRTSGRAELCWWPQNFPVRP